MVFGASESKKVTDEEFIKDLVKDVGVNAVVKFVTRIGNQTKKSRPIKEVYYNLYFGLYFQQKSSLNQVNWLALNFKFAGIHWTLALTLTLI